MAEAAVVGFPHDIKGNAIVAFVTPRSVFEYDLVTRERTLLKQTEVHRLSAEAQVLLAFIKGENRRLETWKHYFPEPSPDWAQVSGTLISITKPNLLIEAYSEEGGCRRLTEDEATQLKNELKKQDQSLKLAAEKLARNDWARQFPDIRDRPIPTGQTNFYEGKYKPKKIGK